MKTLCYFIILVLSLNQAYSSSMQTQNSISTIKLSLKEKVSSPLLIPQYIGNKKYDFIYNFTENKIKDFLILDYFYFNRSERKLKTITDFNTCKPYYPDTSCKLKDLTMITNYKSYINFKKGKECGELLNDLLCIFNCSNGSENNLIKNIQNDFKIIKISRMTCFNLFVKCYDDVIDYDYQSFCKNKLNLPFKMKIEVTDENFVNLPNENCEEVLNKNNNNLLIREQNKNEKEKENKNYQTVYYYILMQYNDIFETNPNSANIIEDFLNGNLDYHLNMLTKLFYPNFNLLDITLQQKLIKVLKYFVEFLKFEINFNFDVINIQIKRDEVSRIFTNFCFKISDYLLKIEDNVFNKEKNNLKHYLLSNDELDVISFIHFENMDFTDEFYNVINGNDLKYFETYLNAKFGFLWAGIRFTSVELLKHIKHITKHLINQKMNYFETSKYGLDICLEKLKREDNFNEPDLHLKENSMNQTQFNLNLTIIQEIENKINETIKDSELIKKMKDMKNKLKQENKGYFNFNKNKSVSFDINKNFNKNINSNYFNNTIKTDFKNVTQIVDDKYYVNITSNLQNEILKEEIVLMLNKNDTNDKEEIVKSIDNFKNDLTYFNSTNIINTEFNLNNNKNDSLLPSNNYQTIIVNNITEMKTQLNKLIDSNTTNLIIIMNITNASIFKEEIDYKNTFNNSLYNYTQPLSPNLTILTNLTDFNYIPQIITNNSSDKPLQDKTNLITNKTNEDNFTININENSENSKNYTIEIISNLSLLNSTTVQVFNNLTEIIYSNSTLEFEIIKNNYLKNKTILSDDLILFNNKTIDTQMNQTEVLEIKNEKIENKSILIIEPEIIISNEKIKNNSKNVINQNESKINYNDEVKINETIISKFEDREIKNDLIIKEGNPFVEIYNITKLEDNYNDIKNETINQKLQNEATILKDINETKSNDVINSVSDLIVKDIHPIMIKEILPMPIIKEKNPIHEIQNGSISKTKIYEENKIFKNETKIIKIKEEIKPKVKVVQEINPKVEEKETNIISETKPKVELKNKTVFEYYKPKVQVKNKTVLEDSTLKLDFKNKTVEKENKSKTILKEANSIVEIKNKTILKEINSILEIKNKTILKDIKPKAILEIKDTKPKVEIKNKTILKDIKPKAILEIKDNKPKVDVKNKTILKEIKPKVEVKNKTILKEIKPKVEVKNKTSIKDKKPKVYVKNKTSIKDKKPKVDVKNKTIIINNKPNEEIKNKTTIKYNKPKEEIKNQTSFKDNKPKVEIKNNTSIKEIKPILEIKNNTSIKEIKPILEIKNNTSIKEIKHILEIKNNTSIKEIKNKTIIKDIKVMQNETIIKYDTENNNTKKEIEINKTQNNATKTEEIDTIPKSTEEKDNPNESKNNTEKEYYNIIKKDVEKQNETIIKQNITSPQQEKQNMTSEEISNKNLEETKEKQSENQTKIEIFNKLNNNKNNMTKIKNDSILKENDIKTIEDNFNITNKNIEIILDLPINNLNVEKETTKKFLNSINKNKFPVNNDTIGGNTIILIIYNFTVIGEVVVYYLTILILFLSYFIIAKVIINKSYEYFLFHNYKLTPKNYSFIFLNLIICLIINLLISLMLYSEILVFLIFAIDSELIAASFIFHLNSGKVYGPLGFALFALLVSFKLFTNYFFLMRIFLIILVTVIFFFIGVFVGIYKFIDYERVDVRKRVRRPATRLIDDSVNKSFVI